jgi:lantibiotic biosynthesis protein
VTTKPRRRTPQRFYDPLAWVIVRAPLLPVDAYLGLVDQSLAAAERWQTENRTLSPTDPWVRLALMVGGGHLLQALQSKAQEDKSARSKLLRYQIRMSTRPTPYGLFAGVALGELGETTNIAIDGSPPVRRARPDMGWLLSFAAGLEARPEIRRQLQVMVHPAAFSYAGRIFLANPTPLGNADWPPHVSVRESQAVRAALTRARTPISYTLLADELCGLPGADADKVEQLLTELWQQGLLLTDLRPPLTTACPATYVARRLLSLADQPPEARRLDATLGALSDWGRLNPTEAAAKWPRLEESLKELHPTNDTPIQVDLALHLKNATINEQVAHEAARAAELLLRLTLIPRGATHLSAYRAAFESRYGHDREVPLIELLDPHFGLGPPSNYGHGGGSGFDARRMANRYDTLQTLALDAVAKRRLVIELDDATLGRLATWDPTPEALPLSLDLCFFVIAPSAAAIDEGRFLIALGPNVGARQAGRYLGRFADLLGSPALQALAEIMRAEAMHSPHAIQAELVYLPRRLRSANVVIRPAVHDYEIAVGVSPGVPRERTIPLDELTVSVSKGRFRLRWRGPGTDVIVRAGHMLTNFNAPEVCRFLDDLADDGVAQLSMFDWGAVASYPFLPRIQSGRIILSPARWRITPALRDAAFPADTDFLEKLAYFRKEWNLPRYVYLATGDNRLLLDLEASDQVAELRKELAQLHDSGAVILQEALPGPEHAWIPGPNGHYLTELVVPLVLGPRKSSLPTQQVTRQDELRQSLLPVLPLTRLRPPGSDWLFLKIYCPSILEDELLISAVRDFCHETSRAGLLDGWFFLRYSDPDPHIRLRFRGDPHRLLSRLLPEVCSWCAELMSEGLCQRFAFDTYDREIERYGGPAGMALAEAVFTADSPAVVDILTVLRKRANLDRLTVAVISIDDLLASIGLDEIERLDWYKRQVTSRRTSGDEFRERKTTLRSLLGTLNGLTGMTAGPELAQIFAERQRSLAPIARSFAELDKQRELTKARESILPSIVHMHCNRLVGADRTIEERALGLLLRVRQSLKESPPRAPTAEK